MNTNKTRIKSFIGGLVIGSIITALITTFVCFLIGGTLFINYELNRQTVADNLKIITNLK
jgi:hypothetical protein